MKVLHIITVNRVGGAEKLMLQLLPALSKECGIECLIFYKKDDRTASADIAGGLQAQGIRVIQESHSSLFDKKALGKIRRTIYEGKYDLIHSHLKYPDVWLSWLKFTRKISVPVVTTIHGYNDAYQNLHGFSIKKSVLYRSPYYYLTRWTYRRLDGVILISSIVKRFFEGTGMIGRNIPRQVIYHGYKEVQPLPYAGIKAAPRLAIPGRLLLLKGHRFAIAAVKLLKEKGIDLSLHIFGDGPERHAISQQIRELGLDDCVIMHGYVSDMVEKLKEMDIVLAPSLWEGFGLVILDGFAAGKPVVTFDLPACNEIVKHNVNGLIATPSSPESLAANVEKLLGDKTLCERLVDAGYQSLRVDFSMKRMSAEYLEFYRKRISGKTI